MRGLGHLDPIESVKVTHEEGNEREKIGVERGIGAFYGAKLLIKQGERTAHGRVILVFISIRASG